MNETDSDDNQDFEEIPEEAQRIIQAGMMKRRMCLPPAELAENWNALLFPYEIEPDDPD